MIPQQPPIDADVLAAAKQFGLDPALVQAVVTAEGNIVRAVQCSYPTITDRSKALEITCRSCVHAMSDFLRAKAPAAFVSFWADRWAPRGAANDPTDLNKNWPRNVLTLWAPPAPKVNP